MLRVVSHKSAAAARKYYSEGLHREDYYSEKQEVVGKWHGNAARLLGLDGDVTPEAFAALVENRHPVTGGRLTARTNSDRVVGYDLNFHAPKSLSVLHALTGDENLVGAFRAAVAETMADMEMQTATRVRQKGAQANRVTGNFAWAEFVHFTARPVEGIPDPHLHVHCFTFNATHDFIEGRWKAANFRDIKADAPYSEAVFHSRLTGKLAALGYGIERTPKGWEITGIPRSVIDKFSRRTAQIERLAEKRGIHDAKDKDALGAASREGKRHGMTYSDLLAAWGVRLTPDEKVMIFKAGDHEVREAPEKITAAKALDEASEKLFAKNSVVESRRLVAEALRYGVGQVTPEKAWQEFGKRGMVVREVGGKQLCTSVKVLAEEVALINYVRSGRGMYAPLKGQNIRFGNEALSAEQKGAVRHILNSRDQVIGIRGGAGVGKTTMMGEAVPQIEASGRRVFAFAPSAAASRGTLREAGFASAQTLAHLLSNPKLQRETRGQVIWVDEAGLIGTRDMWKLLQIAGDSTRVILTGDTAQHAPVARGDAFRLLQNYAGLKVAEVTQIRRQEGEGYRNAVAALSKGDLRTAFRRLDDLNAIIEVTDDTERYNLLAADYLSLSRKGHTPLVVSPTHAEGAKVTEAIRNAKRAAGHLGNEKTFIRYQDLRWEEPDRRRPENYHDGLMVQFNQNLHGIRRGEIFRVAGRDEKGGVMMENAHRKIPLPLKDAARFQVYEERQIEVARGDRIRITRNGNSDDGKRLNNGDVFTIAGFNKNGNIRLHTGAELNSRHGHFTLGYCETSHATQSKSVRDVLVAQSADSFLASSREQFYVSVSRGKETIRIYTDSRRELESAVGISSTRKSGVELAGFSKGEVGALVSGDGSQQWRERVRKQQADKTSQSHVERLLAARKMDGTRKPADMDFRQFLAMKQALASADGRSRSKGHPSGAGKKVVNTQNQGRSFARPIEMRLSTQQKMLAANENKVKAQATQNQPGKQAAQEPVKVHPRRERFAKSYEAAKSRLGEVVKNMKGKVAAVRDQALPKSNTAQLAKNAEQRPMKTNATMAKTNAKVAQKPVQKQKQAPPPPPPPPPKRGR
jgi:conjugative relaxase-like TrwC/TraI family protein